MKSWVLTSTKHLEHLSKDDLVRTDGFNKVKIVKALLSESDFSCFTGKTKVRLPLTLGRFAIGQVIEPDANTFLQKGDRVYLADFIDDEEAESGVRLAGFDTDGYFCDFALLKDSELFPLPPSVPDEDAFLIDAVAFAERVIDEAHLSIGQHVLVIGGGIYSNVLCQVLIYHRIVPILIDNNEERTALAKKCGIYYVFPFDDTLSENVMKATGGHKADASVYFSSSNKIEPSVVFNLLKRNSYAVFGGALPKSLTVNLEYAVKNNVTVKCLTESKEYISNAINLLANKHVLSDRFKFETVNEDGLGQTLEGLDEADESLNERFLIFKFVL